MRRELTTIGFCLSLLHAASYAQAPAKAVPPKLSDLPPRSALIAAGFSNPAQEEWFGRRDARPTTFEVPAGKADQRWSRAKAWISRCSDLKLQTIDSELLDTYSPPLADSRIGYTVSRELLDDGSWRFIVRSFTGTPGTEDIALPFARSLSLYIETGEDCPRCPCGVRP